MTNSDYRLLHLISVSVGDWPVDFDLSGVTAEEWKKVIELSLE